MSTKLLQSYGYMEPEEVCKLSIIFNKHAHVENGKWNDSHVLMLFQFVDSDWKIQSDYSKLYVHQGRKRSNRFRNEMDIRHSDEPRKCGLCHQFGHNRRNCSKSQPRYNVI
uniref:Uncharacterized protein n=1 Tax=Lactuca sativa TaxID=4236 RepID=A0A9R1XLP3_LACSA|nr:hypothetical protein LSAT_V11C300151990 [Lactuca sativa]